MKMLESRECLNKECLSNSVAIRYSKDLYQNEKWGASFIEIPGLIDDWDQLGWTVEI